LSLVLAIALAIALSLAIAIVLALAPILHQALQTLLYVFDIFS
jgi:hypothetical protein